MAETQNTTFLCVSVFFLIAKNEQRNLRKQNNSERRHKRA